MNEKDRMKKDIEVEERHLVKTEYVVIAILVIVVAGLILYIWFK